MQTFEVKILKTEAGVLVHAEVRWSNCHCSRRAARARSQVTYHPSAAEPLQAAAHLAPARMLRDPRPGRGAHSGRGRVHGPARRAGSAMPYPAAAGRAPAESASSTVARPLARAERALAPRAAGHLGSCRGGRCRRRQGGKGHWLLLAHGAHVHERRDRPSRGGLR